MDSSYMNDGRMNACSPCSCNQSRRMEDLRRMDNRRRVDASRRMDDRRREEVSRRMDDRRCEVESRCMNDKCREEAPGCKDERCRECSCQTDDKRCPDKSCPMGKFEPFDKTDGLALAMAYVPWQCYQDTFDLRKGLHVGTIFPELCKPFCGKRGVRQC